MNKFLICDLASIETRVGAWLAQCPALNKVFADNRDAYIDFATKLYTLPYDRIYADYKSEDEARSIAAKSMRQFAKPGVLGSIYRMGGGKWIINKDGDRVRTGLWGYAHNMGIEMSQEQAHMITRVFRTSYPEIPEFWKEIEDAVLDVMKGTTTVRYVGPNDCVKIDKLNVTGLGCIMRMHLPSGRKLHYMNARIESLKMPWENEEGETVYRDGLVYASVDQNTKKWGVTSSHGGKLFENLVQGIARDILACKLVLLEQADMPIVLHVHDEGVALVPDDSFSPVIEDMIRLMSSPVEWCPGLLLGADGFESQYYRK